MVLVLPWLHTSPVVVEALLYYLHVFSGSLLCIALHLSVKRGVNLQTVAIEVDTLQTLVLLTQLFDILRYSLTEILRLSVIVVLHVKLRYVNAGILGINVEAIKSIYTSDLFWVYFSKSFLTDREKQRFLSKTRKDQTRIAYFQYSKPVFDLVLEQVPEELRKQLLWDEEHIIGQMNFWEKVYNK